MTQIITSTTTSRPLPSKYARVEPLYRVTQVIWYLLDVVEVFLGFRFLLSLFGANTSAGFSSFIYEVTHPFVAPFLSVFGVTQVAGSTFEWTTLLAMLVYWIIAWAIVRLVLLGKPISVAEANYKLSEQDSTS